MKFENIRIKDFLKTWGPSILALAVCLLVGKIVLNVVLTDIPENVDIGAPPQPAFGLWGYALFIIIPGIILAVLIVLRRSTEPSEVDEDG